MSENPFPAPEGPRYLSYGPDTHMTQKERHERFNQYLEWWKTSPCRARLIASIEKNNPPGGRTISQAVLMAVGQLNDANWKLEFVDVHNGRMVQLVAFVDTVRYFEVAGNATIPMYAQEPDFDASDIEFVESLGITVIEKPRAEEMVSDTSFYMMPFFGEDFRVLSGPPNTRPSLTISLDPSLEWTEHWIATEAGSARKYNSNPQLWAARQAWLDRYASDEARANRKEAWAQYKIEAICTKECFGGENGHGEHGVSGLYVWNSMTHKTSPISPKFCDGWQMCCALGICNTPPAGGTSFRKWVEEEKERVRKKREAEEESKEAEKNMEEDKQPKED